MNNRRSHYYINDDSSSFKRKKNILIGSTLTLLLLIVIAVLLSGINTNKSTNTYISAGICGAVKRPAVYRLPVNACLADIIKQANGLTYNADIRNIDLNTILQKDSIYHIPVKKEKEFILDKRTIDNMETAYTVQDKSKEINFFYVGYPALYFLINYNTETNRTLVTYIPHSSLFLDNEYRLIDVYFTLGRDYAIDLLAKSLGTKIDYYFVQDRTSFINMIDGLNGLEMDVDQWFAEEYNLKPGKQVLDGFHSFEFIRYIQKKTKLTIFRDNNLQLAYNLRQSRMKRTIKSLFANFKKSSATHQLSTLASVMLHNNTDTNVGMEEVTELVQQLVDNKYIDFETIPGYYTKKNKNLYYIPTEWNSRQLKKERELKNYNVVKGDKQQILY